VPNAQAFLHVIFQLVAASAADSAAGDRSGLLHVYLAAMEAVSLYYQVSAWTHGWGGR
jgi:hypothetical protein